MIRLLPILAACCVVIATVAARADGLTGNATHGKEIFNGVCIACHSLHTNRTGPELGDVFGRKAGSVPGFDYSRALSQAGFVWTAARLNDWLKGPMRYLPGVRMPISVDSAQDRADVIAFLRQQAARN